MKDSGIGKKGSLAEQVEALIAPLCEELGFYSWDVEYAKRGPDNYLTITIDNDEGINIEDCEKLHRAVDPLLDEVDIISNAYMLEVSSPGIERELSRDEHFEWAIGEEVEIKLYAAVNGAKSYKGELVSYDGSTITVRSGENEISLDYKNVSKAKTIFDFGK